MQGIICDVGHTIITNSILNQILSELGKQDAVVKLYDEDKLAGKTQKDIDEWVRKVSSYKINSMRGVSLDKLKQYCKQAQFTSGLKDFIHFTIRQNIPLLFIGTVPKVVTEQLLKALGIDVEQQKTIHVEGTTVQIVNDLIVKPLDICTPSVKFALAKRWMETHNIGPAELIVIGDSIGDVPVMHLTEQENRIAIHLNSQTLREILGQEANDFEEILNIVEAKLSTVVLE